MLPHRESPASGAAALGDGSQGPGRSGPWRLHKGYFPLTQPKHEAWPETVSCNSPALEGARHFWPSDAQRFAGVIPQKILLASQRAQLRSGRPVGFAMAVWWLSELTPPAGWYQCAPVTYRLLYKRRRSHEQVGKGQGTTLSET